MQKVTALLVSENPYPQVLALSQEMATGRWGQHVFSLLGYVERIYAKALGQGDAPVEVEDEEVLVRYSDLLFNLLNGIITALPNRQLQCNLQEIQEVVIKLLNLQRTPAGIEGRVWEVLKEGLIGQILTFLQTLITITGAAHPIYVNLTNTLSPYCTKVTVAACDYFRAVLNRGGGLYWNLAYSYIERSGVVQYIIGCLDQISVSEAVLLTKAKKLRTKKPGNSHQRRRVKLLRRKSEALKLREIGSKAKATDLDINMLTPSLKLLTAYITTRPPQIPQLRPLLSYNPTHLPPEFLPIFFKTLLTYTIATGTDQLRLKRLLEKAVKSGSFLTTGRFCKIYLDLFLLSQNTK